MNEQSRSSLWQQFGAAIDMLDNSVMACPDELWSKPLWLTPGEPSGYSEFWYLTSHALFWLDYYLSGAVEDFVPPAPFTLIELDPNGFPDRIYTKAELLNYVQHCRHKCHDIILTLTDEEASRICRFGKREMSFLECLLYNMRHVQEHAAQLNLFLGQKGVPVVSWVAQAKEIK